MPILTSSDAHGFVDSLGGIDLQEVVSGGLAEKDGLKWFTIGLTFKFLGQHLQMGFRLYENGELECVHIGGSYVDSMACSTDSWSGIWSKKWRSYPGSTRSLRSSYRTMLRRRY